jgi:hypothetical protein
MNDHICTLNQHRETNFQTLSGKHYQIDNWYKRDQTNCSRLCIDKHWILDRSLHVYGLHDVYMSNLSIETHWNENHWHMSNLSLRNSNSLHCNKNQLMHLAARVKDKGNNTIVFAFSEMIPLCSLVWIFVLQRVYKYRAKYSLPFFFIFLDSLPNVASPRWEQFYLISEFRWERSIYV